MIATSLAPLVRSLERLCGKLQFLRQRTSAETADQRLTGAAYWPKVAAKRAVSGTAILR
jgi:hypothetical protein